MIVQTACGADETATWFNGNGNWSDASNWSNVPVLIAFPNDGNQGKTYDAIINGGTVTLDQAISIQGLAFSFGTITGPGTLTLSGATTWSGGTMSGAGVTHVNAGTSLAINNTTGTPILDGRTLDLAGSATADAGQLNLQNGGTLNLLSGGALRGNQVIYSGGPGTLNVLAGGTLTRSGVTYAQTSVFTPLNNAGAVNVTQGTLTMLAPFNNNGAVQVQGGQLLLDGGGSSTGSFTVANGAALTFAADYSLLPGASIASGASSALAVTDPTAGGGKAALGVVANIRQQTLPKPPLS
jgi:hypothetical protein